jgi:hypothetical protein
MSESLLELLAGHVNSRGVVLVAEEVLLREAGATREGVVESLGKLERAGLVEILSPLPYLVLRLRTWPGKGQKVPVSALSAYSSSKQLLHKQQLNSSYRQDPRHEPVDPQLLGEILETLGESDGKTFEKAVELYSPHVIRLALDRVRRAKGIRKSRTALFRHLLPRLARDEHRVDSPPQDP